MVKDVIQLNKTLLKTFFGTQFLSLSFFGNSFIITFAYLFFHLEQNVNPSLKSFIDALWWAYATATTVGYGDVTPITFWGKVLGILLMLSGTALFAIFTAIFAQAILEDDAFVFKKK